MTDVQSTDTPIQDHSYEMSNLRFTAQEESSNVNTDDEGDEDETGDKKYTCPHCPHAFTRKHNLKSHLLIHTQEKPFCCMICSAKFRRLHDLKRHSKLHTGEKPHQCKSCGRKFARADALVRHNNSQAGCSVLIDDVLLEQPDKDQSPVSTPKIIPQKRNFETSRWRLQTETESESSLVPDVSRETSGEVSATANTTANTTKPSTETTTQELALPPTQSPENISLFPYVRLLEARIETLEQKLSAAETRISHLTYAMTGQRPSQA